MSPLVETLILALKANSGIPGHLWGFRTHYYKII